MLRSKAAIGKYDWNKAGDLLENAMREYYPQLISLAYVEAADIGLGIRFDEANPLIKDTIDGLATRIRGVADTTRDDIRRIVDDGTSKGWGDKEIARMIRTVAPDISKSRANTIARTETATAYNHGSLLAYAEGGIERVEVLDSDDDPACAEANGQIWTLEQAAAEPVAHPNCVRAFAPIVGR